MTETIVTRTRGTDETSELHIAQKGDTVALCGATDQVRTTTADRDVYLRPHCFTCSEDDRLDRED
jgi:hypothetical protein